MECRGERPGRRRKGHRLEAVPRTRNEPGSTSRARVWKVWIAKDSVGVMNYSWRKCRPQGVQDGENVDDFLNDRAADRLQMTGGGEDHADDTHCHATHRALERDGPHAMTDMHELVHFLE